MQVFKIVHSFDNFPFRNPKYTRPGDEKKVVVGMKNGPLQLLDEELEPLQVFPAQQISRDP